MSTKLQQAPVIRTLSTSSAASTLLPPGIYQMTADVDCFVLQGASSVAATTSSNPLWSKGFIKIRVSDATDGYVAGITASGTGNLYFIKVPE